MIRRELHIGRWLARFVFATDGYDEDEILDTLYDLDASDYILVKAAQKMREGKPDEGFTYANRDIMEALVVIGPTTSAAQFQNTLVHEIHHLAVAVADSLGVDLYSETPAYVAGDSAMGLAEVICRLGCDRCRPCE